MIPPLPSLLNMHTVLFNGEGGHQCKCICPCKDGRKSGTASLRMEKTEKRLDTLGIGIMWIRISVRTAIDQEESLRKLLGEITRSHHLTSNRHILSRPLMSP